MKEHPILFTGPMVRAIEILKESGPSRASDLGLKLWGKRGKSKHHYSKQAARVLNELFKAGLVDYSLDNKRRIFWRAIKQIEMRKP